MISQRAKNLKPSPTMSLATLAGQLRSEGRDIISLSVGEPDWDTFPAVKEAGIQAIQEGRTKYLPASGMPALREAIAGQIEKDIGVAYSSSEVTVSTGAKFIVFGALQVLIDPGDEVVIPAPYWVSYPDMVELAGGTPKTVVCSKEVSFKLTPELLRSSLSEKTKALILNSPSNPTGQVYTPKELAALCEVLQEFPRVVILSDDIYNRLYFEGSLAPHLLQEDPSLSERTLVINGVSKSYSMTGWRVGWAAGPKEVISAMNRYQSQSVSCACSVSQHAALHAVLHGESDAKDSLGVLQRRMELVFAELSKLPGLETTRPQGAFYFWPDISSHFGRSFGGEKVTGSEDFSRLLLESEGVAATAGVHFGLEGYLRISYALSDERMLEAMTRIRRFIDALDG